MEYRCVYKAQKNAKVKKVVDKRRNKVYCAVTNLRPRCDTIWADAAEIIIVASRCLSHAKINPPESNAYLINSGWSSQPMGDRVRHNFLFPSPGYHTLMCISNFTPRRKLSFVPDRSRADPKIFIALVRPFTYDYEFWKCMLYTWKN